MWASGSRRGRFHLLTDTTASRNPSRAAAGVPPTSRCGLAGAPLGGLPPRCTLHGLTRSRFFGAVSDRLLISNLKQVRRHLTEPELRDAVQARTEELILPDTRVVVGHSRGSVVAYEVLHAAPSADESAVAEGFTPHSSVPVSV